jgi:hypothetical protein
MNASSQELNLERWAHLALALQWGLAEGLPISNLQNLRTEIVLNDARDVAFWFSLSFRVVTFRQQNAGNRDFQFGHPTELELKPLFPKIRACGEGIKSVEDESKD